MTDTETTLAIYESGAGLAGPSAYREKVRSSSGPPSLLRRAGPTPPASSTSWAATILLR